VESELGVDVWDFWGEKNFLSITIVFEKSVLWVVRRLMVEFDSRV
jgi:hypothetical protein